MTSLFVQNKDIKCFFYLWSKMRNKKTSYPYYRCSGMTYIKYLLKRLFSGNWYSKYQKECKQSVAWSNVEAVGSGTADRVRRTAPVDRLTAGSVRTQLVPRLAGALQPKRSVISSGLKRCGSGQRQTGSDSEPPRKRIRVQPKTISDIQDPILLIRKSSQNSKLLVCFCYSLLFSFWKK